MSTLRDELLELKTQLEGLEHELTDQLVKQQKRSERWVKFDEEALELKTNCKDMIVTLNIGGKKFQSKLDTLLQIKDSLFYHLVLDRSIDLSKEIFIDRDPLLFKHILSFLRYNKVNTKNFTYEMFEDLYDEAAFYGITQLRDDMDEMRKEPIFESFEYSGPYVYNGGPVASNNIDDINDYENRTCTKGICAMSPGWIIFVLKFPIKFSEIEVAGFTGNTMAWGISNGSNANVYTSIDKESWENVGRIGSLTQNITPIKLTTSFAKYIKVQNNSYLGFGYFRVIKDKS